jgi:polyhydroxybutyrate depolymerase
MNLPGSFIVIFIRGKIMVETMRTIFIIFAVSAAAAAGCGKSLLTGRDGEADDADVGGDTAGETAEAEPDQDREPGSDPDAEPAADGEEDAPSDIEPGEDGTPSYCPVPGDLGPGDHTVSIAFGGMDRSTILHVPPAYDSSAPTPLVLNIHGFMSAAWQQVLFSNMNPTADARGFIVAYPDGYQSSWNAGSCCGTAASMGLDDVGFLKAVVADITSKLCIDAKRVYATGMSNGGYMSHRLGCEASDVFAAVAPVSGAMGIADCTPPRPVPVMAFHGIQDNLVPYDSGHDAVTQWLWIDGCGTTATRTAYGASSYCDLYETCNDGVKVGFCTLDPMGHCWPGGSESLCFFAIGPYNNDLNASEVMWDFFSQFTLP